MYITFLILSIHTNPQAQNVEVLAEGFLRSLGGMEPAFHAYHSVVTPFQVSGAPSASALIYISQIILYGGRVGGADWLTALLVSGLCVGRLQGGGN